MPTSFSHILCHCKFVTIGVNKYFFAQMTWRAIYYDVIYHPFPINSQYLKTWGIVSPVNILCIWSGSAFLLLFSQQSCILNHNFVRSHFLEVEFLGVFPSRNYVYSQTPCCILVKFGMPRIPFQTLYNLRRFPFLSKIFAKQKHYVPLLTAMPLKGDLFGVEFRKRCIMGPKSMSPPSWKSA